MRPRSLVLFCCGSCSPASGSPAAAGSAGGSNSRTASIALPGKAASTACTRGWRSAASARGIDRGLRPAAPGWARPARPRPRRPSAGRSIPSAAGPAGWRDWSAPAARPELDAAGLEMHEMDVAHRGWCAGSDRPAHRPGATTSTKLCGARLRTPARPGSRSAAGRGLCATAPPLGPPPAPPACAGAEARGAEALDGRRRHAGAVPRRRVRRAWRCRRHRLQQTAGQLARRRQVGGMSRGGSAPSRRPAAARARPGPRPAPSAASASSGSARASRARPASSRPRRRSISAAAGSSAASGTSLIRVSQCVRSSRSCSSSAGSAPRLIELGQHGQRPRRLALHQQIEEIEQPAAVGEAQHVADLMPRRSRPSRPRQRDRLVEQRQPVAHRAVGGARDQRERGRRRPARPRPRRSCA